MENEEINVDQIVNEAATADDMLSDEIIEEAEDTSESLDSIIGEERTEPVEEQPEQKGTAEPGYVQKRIEKALAKERESMRSEILAEVEAQYAPIRERLLEMDAQELVRKGTVKDLETAKELVRYRNGQSAAPKAPAEPERQRNDKGQFSPKNDPVVEAKVDMLSKQADKISEKTGLDVVGYFSSHADIKQKVLDGEMDFYDIAEIMKASAPAERRKPPAPARSSNGASGQSPNAIENMTDEQFARLERKIKEGARYSLR